MKLHFIIFLALILLLSSCTVRIVRESEPSAAASPAASPAVSSGSGKRIESGLFDPENWSGVASALSPKEPVDDEWFSGCCLLGDSLTDGMRLFSGLDTPDYLCSGGADPTNILERAAEGKSGTVADYLSSEKYRAVFIMIGVNEIGGAPESFRTHYENLLDYIIEHQSGADIYVQSILPVTAAKDAEGSFTNDRIDEFNAVLQEICAERSLVYVDLHSEFADENGCLPDYYSWDGLHLTVAAYEHWADCLRLFAARW